MSRLLLLLHGGPQVVKSNTKSSGHFFLDFCQFFFVSHTVSTIEAGLMALEDGLSSSLPPRTREEKAPWPRPKTALTI